MSGFSDTLVRLREQAGLSQQELADRLGVSRSRIGMYETARREPDFDTLMKIADLFGVRPGDLLGPTSLLTLIAADNGMKEVYHALTQSEDDPWLTLPADESRLLDLYRAMNTEGQEKLVDYADDLVTSGKYIKK